MAANQIVWVVAEGRVYRVWADGSKPCCVEELRGGGEKQIDDWDQIPKVIDPLVTLATNLLIPQPPRSPLQDPWQNPHFRFGSLNHCVDCPKLSS
jgi:hypothetical protein